MIDQHSSRPSRKKPANCWPSWNRRCSSWTRSATTGDVVGRAFRALHTIKGSGAMFGFDDIAGFAHHLETVFDQLRNGQLAATADLINLSLAAGDQIKAMLDEAAGRGAADPERSAGILAELRQLTGATGAATARAAPARRRKPARAAAGRPAARVAHPLSARSGRAAERNQSAAAAARAAGAGRAARSRSTPPPFRRSARSIRSAAIWPGTWF